MSTLDALVQIIANGVKDIQSKSAERGTPWPTPDTSLSPESEKLQSGLAASTAPVIAAAWQLIATLKHPQTYLLDLVLSSFLSGSMSVAEAAYVPNVLRKAGTKVGLHVNDIAAVRNIDAGKLGRILRHLASRHIFEEVAPDIFRNNRISSALCTGKPIQEMLGSPINRWDGTNGVAALVSLNGGTIQRGNALLTEHLLDPAIGHSQKLNEAAWQRAMRTDLVLFEWLELPEHAMDLHLCSIGMRHGFFAEQPITDADVFVLWYVLHDWSDKYASKILLRLRDAAQPATKLVVMDIIVDYMCHDSGAVADISGATKPQAPEPLLPYADSAASFTYSLDISMMCCANCQERTLGQFIELLKSTGWKVERVCCFEPPLPQQLICSPL
ncbi:uncharacterized protein PHACADRAFT_196229 [Phanerochaete carnosa HHB-10118-sp]|uniref:O-methyltransferase C-terminal domain-containing protein n=1 Tax=Phanerochaete carnosa (strain HHB-10118-sp) TaxID=650164 RepID=K5WB07_PHACS|nr:uncharacterized protein PHACADRAFT_196229 [Phanerochaete carnosa HHB-10118-sp]EKM56174.1 hypothetical protein PHACADRAFT_196229 [Phanerochaete carnosa HHB-10118-sp]